MSYNEMTSTEESYRSWAELDRLDRIEATAIAREKMTSTYAVSVDNEGTVSMTVLDKLDPAPRPPLTLANLAAYGTPRAARPTMAGAHLTDLSEPQETILVQALFNDGSIPKGPNIRTIRALVRKGYMDFNYRSTTGPRREPIGGRLNARGTRAALRIQTARKLAEVR